MADQVFAVSGSDHNTVHSDVIGDVLIRGSSSDIGLPGAGHAKRRRPCLKLAEFVVSGERTAVGRAEEIWTGLQLAEVIKRGTGVSGYRVG
jgi:hypothetical protein